jgi:hypothetical protein
VIAEDGPEMLARETGRKERDETEKIGFLIPQTSISI